MKGKTLLTLLVSLALFSCNDKPVEDFTNSETPSFDSKNMLRIEREKPVISADDAQNVAYLFFNKGNKVPTKTGQNMSVEIISDQSTGRPLLYVVNFGDNNGFVVVSASKKCTPILAFSDKGSFDSSDSSAAKIYIDSYKSAIKEAYLDTSDSLRLKYALQWASYEKRLPVTKSISYELSQKIQAEVQRKEALGYEHLGNITAAQYFLPESNYQSLLQEMRDVTDPQYDYTEVNQFFIKSYDYESIGPLLQTEWHQDAPFNIDAPNGYAGCVPIAIAQIAYYYKHPDWYFWEKIPLCPGIEYEANFVSFITDIRNICNAKYYNDRTSVSSSDAENALIELGYGVVKYGTISYNTLYPQISNNKPMFLNGYLRNGDGHAWVCDGYMNRRYEASISFVPSENDPRFRVDRIPGSIFVDYDTFAYSPSWLNEDQYGDFFHMNMGWKDSGNGKGNGNGWYKNGVYGMFVDTGEAYTSGLESWAITKIN
ncbi:MAG: C10 family peptidase [Muribaculaceae bacterium]